MRAQEAARNGIDLGVSPNDSSGSSIYSSVFSNRDRSNPHPIRSLDVEDNEPAVNGYKESQMEAPPGPKKGGLASCRRMHDVYRITSQNAVARRGGMRDAYITVRGPSLPLRTFPISFSAWLQLWGEGSG
jgi:hypothetical protein